jgi:hypothetical protein
MVFSEDMRKPEGPDPADAAQSFVDRSPAVVDPPTDGGEQAPTDGGGGGGRGDADADADPDAPTQTPCVMTAPAVEPTADCPGGRPNWEYAGGRAEAEPNDEAPEAVALKVPICGVTRAGDVDRFMLLAQAGKCYYVTLKATAAAAKISGPGFDGTVTAGNTFFFKSSMEGSLTVEVSSPSPDDYRMIIR